MHFPLSLNPDMRPDGMAYIIGGREYRVTAIFTTDGDANRHLEACPYEGVLACVGALILCARCHDMGRTFEAGKRTRLYPAKLTRGG